MLSCHNVFLGIINTIVFNDTFPNNSKIELQSEIVLVETAFLDQSEVEASVLVVFVGEVVIANGWFTLPECFLARVNIHCGTRVSGGSEES